MSDEGELPLVRRNGKSDSAFRTISEVADELEVPQHVLRFWESKFPQVRPLKRGGGRRYYRPEDVALLRRIRDLLYSEGYTIKGVQKLLREGVHKETAKTTASDLELPLGSQESRAIPAAILPEDDAAEDMDADMEAEGEDDGTNEAVTIATAFPPPLPPQAISTPAQNPVDTVPVPSLRPRVREELELLLDELVQMRNLLS